MRKYKIIILIETIIIILSGCIFVTEQTVKPNSRWISEKAPDKKHEIVACIPEDHAYSETTTALFMIYDENHDFDTRSFLVRNNHKILNENNYELEWHDDYVKLTIINYDDFKRTRCIYRIYWEDLNFEPLHYDE
ncbi:MAG: hypothetical protein K2J71_01745 [Oscillospiraceae bacterium]|nr:hypothetical protein [Oscillospiraceae bacterium]MDE7122308.1 hypothetical protein [Oscillospiraceae bacterium]